MAGSSTPEELAAELEAWSNVLMPEWAYSASRYWYDHGGREQRDQARLLRRAAAVLREAGVLTPPADEYEQVGWMAPDGSGFASMKLPDYVYPSWQPVFVRRSVLEGSEDTQ